MKINTISRHLREGVRSVTRNGWMSFASAGAISISLFVLGAFLLLALNLNSWTEDVEEQVEIRVFLELTISLEQIEQLQSAIGRIPEVSKVEFVTKDEGLEMMREKLGEDGAEILDGFDGDGNPLPDSFTIEVHEPQQVGQTAEKIEALDQGQTEPRISKVEYGKGTVDTLFKVTNLIRTVILAMVIAMSITAMFLISNTIKLTIVARRREIAIMKLVGATNGFIRWPFFIEGAILGFFGSAIPVLILLFGYGALVKESGLTLGIMMLRILPVSEVMPMLSLLLIGIGLLIGIWGSTISIIKFLKV